MTMRGNTKRRTRRQKLVTIVVALALPLGLATPSDAYPRPGVTELASVASDGTPGNNAGLYGHWISSMSAGGRFVAFTSGSDNLVPSDLNLMTDVFVRDRKANKTEIVSVTSAGEMAVGPPEPLGEGSPRVAISGTGRYVVFESDAVNLVSGDTNLVRDIFVHDRKTGKTERASVASDGSETKEVGGQSSARCPSSCNASISADGRFVVFGSNASDLVEDDTNDGRDIFVHDRKTGRTKRVNVASDGSEAQSPVFFAGWCATIAANGRYVTFSSGAGNLVSDDTNLAGDVFVRDLKLKKTERVSLRSDGSEARVGFENATSRTCDGNHHRSASSISADGRYVVFESSASDLVPNDNSQTLTDFDVFVHDRRTGRTELVSIRSDGQEAEGGSVQPSISPDGRFVVFHSLASDLVEEEVRFGEQVFIHDRKTGVTQLVSSTVDGRATESCSVAGCAINPAVSRGGRYISFYSPADDLVTTETDGWQLFVRDRGLPLGVGGLGGTPPPGQEPPADRICITPDTCIPPGASVSSSDSTDDLNDVVTEQGANLYGASLAYRPQYDDLLAVIELEHMPQVLPGVVSPVFYGLRFKVDNESYEVRATSLLGGTFGLFDCTRPRPACTKVADLRGGYGTTGERVVLSLPLAEIGLENGGKLNNVVAYSGIGSYLTGATKILDTVGVK